MLFADQLFDHIHAAAGVQHMHDRSIVDGRDLDRGVLRTGGCAADQQRHRHLVAFHFATHVDHFVQAGRDQTAQSDHIDVVLFCFFENFLAGDHHAQVDDFVVVALQHDADDVLADVVDVALDGRDQEFASRGGALNARSPFLFFHERFQIGDRLLHHASRFDDLRQKHFALTEQIADDLHAVHQRTFDDLQAAIKVLTRFLGIFDDVLVDTFDQGVLHPLGNRVVAPGQIFARFLLARPFDRFGKFEQSVGRILRDGSAAHLRRVPADPWEFLRRFPIDRH